mgnify:CR=1 FL=1
MFSLLWYCLFGWIVGSVANWFMPRSDQGCLDTVLAGLLGSFAGGLINWVLFGSDMWMSGFVMSVIGTIAVTYITKHFFSQEDDA